MRYFWLAVQVQKDGKYYAYAMRVSEFDNLLSVLAGTKTVNICKSKAKAREIVADWNEGYKANGHYMFDTPQF